MAPKHQLSPQTRRKIRTWVTLWCLSSFTLWFAGCISQSILSPPAGHYITVTMEVTGYCNCGKCCNWESSWFSGPVISSGPHKGDPKIIGFTSSGAKAKHGTLAADITRYPYGTLLEIPGYGVGRVEDTGSAIKGDHIDLWFPTHEQAQQWGHQKKQIKIWLQK